MKSYFNNVYKTLFVVLLIVSISPISTFSQKWVSTKVQKRNVLLEEFTGIHCGYCPDGHKIANNLKNQYPGKVVLVNIHAGGYATPGAGEVDLRTSVGAAVDAASGLSGYPAGTVNRATNPWALSRNQWAGVATQIMNMDSPVNIAVRSVYDAALNKIKTDVEIYYTGNPIPGDKLQIYFLQDSILGAQSGGTQFYPENYKNGLYIHNHVLRMSADGSNWGLPIIGAEREKLITKSFITDVPTIIGNVTPDLSQFKVVAFVVQGNNSNVYTATEEKVTTGIIDKSLIVDLSIKDATQYPTSYKRESFTPKVEVTNNSNKTITKFDVYLEFNGNLIINTFNGTLNQGAKATIEWPAQTANTALASASFKGIYDINDGLIDGTANEINNSVKQLVQFKTDEFSECLIGFNGNMPNYSIFLNEGNPAFSIQNSNNPYLGANGTTGALWFVLDPTKIDGSVSGRAVHTMFGGCDLTGKETAELKYYYAYSDGNRGGTPPVIKVDVSTDWGVSWNNVSTTTCTKTGDITPGYQYYLPKSSDYIPITVDLKNYLNKQFLIRVSGIPGTDGNCFWLDEISVTSKGKVFEGPKISLSNKTFDFGKVDLNKSSEKNLTITNNGDQTLKMTSIDYNNPGEVFSVVGAENASSIEPGESVTVIVKFTPKEEKTYMGSITVNTNAKNESSTTINLAGKGIDPSSVPYGNTIDGNFSMTLSPNPVVTFSKLNYTINNDNSNVRIYVIDITGRVLTELVNSNINVGTYSVDILSNNYANGTYYIMAEINGEQAQIPVVIAK